MSQTRDQQAIERLRSSGGGGGGAPTNASYLVLGYNATLTDERLFTDGHGIDSTDAGAGSTFTVAVDETELSHALLGNRAWTSSGHTGTINTIAGFNGSGAADEYEIGVDLQAYDAGLASLTAADAAAGLPYVSAANTWTSLSLAANKGIYATSASALSTYDLTASGRSIGGVTLSTGDILYASGAATAAVRSIGTTGDVLTVSGGVPTWAAPGTGATQTISASTGTVTAGTATVFVTHASPTITLDALRSAGGTMILIGPNTSGAYAVIVRAGSDTIETGATGIRIDGSGWVLQLTSDGTSWRVRVLRGVCQLPVAVIDTTGVSGSSPWTTPTNAVGGASVTFTDRSTASSTTSASSGILLTPAASTGFWSGSPTGAGVSCEVSALGIDPTKDSFAVIARLPITGTYGANEGASVALGTTVGTASKIGGQVDNLTARARWGSSGNASLGTVSTGDAVGFWWDAQSERVRSLAGAWSGTAQVDLWPMSYGAPGGQAKAVYDPGGGGTTSTDIAALTRILTGASLTTAGETWTLKYLLVVKLITGGQ